MRSLIYITNILCFIANKTVLTVKPTVARISTFSKTTFRDAATTTTISLTTIRQKSKKPLTTKVVTKATPSPVSTSKITTGMVLTTQLVSTNMKTTQTDSTTPATTKPTITAAAAKTSQLPVGVPVVGGPKPTASGSKTVIYGLIIPLAIILVICLVILTVFVVRRKRGQGGRYHSASSQSHPQFRYTNSTFVDDLAPMSVDATSPGGDAQFVNKLYELGVENDIYAQLSEAKEIPPPKKDDDVIVASDMFKVSVTKRDEPDGKEESSSLVRNAENPARESVRKSTTDA